MSKIFYIYYSVSFQYYNWGIAEGEDYSFYKMVTDGTHVECVGEYQALINDKYIEDLKKELINCEDDRAFESIIKKYELMEG